MTSGSCGAASSVGETMSLPQVMRSSFTKSSSVRWSAMQCDATTTSVDAGDSPSGVSSSSCESPTKTHARRMCKPWAMRLQLACWRTTYAAEWARGELERLRGGLGQLAEYGGVVLDVELDDRYLGNWLGPARRMGEHMLALDPALGRGRRGHASLTSDAATSAGTASPRSPNWTTERRPG